MNAEQFISENYHAASSNTDVLICDKTKKKVSYEEVAEAYRQAQVNVTLGSISKTPDSEVLNNQEDLTDEEMQEDCRNIPC